MSSTDELSLTIPAIEDAFLVWRCAADEAAKALAAWTASPGAVRRAAFDAYSRALDHEEDCALALEQERQTSRLLWWLR